ncbi:MAG: hypothetical protein HRT88_23405 [Lentisphaeraceae bacterium]|nr:hypothetical protein [Lentisphaeraceae bacterium]
MLWLEDYPNLQEWSKEMEEIKAHLKRTGKIKNIFRKKCRAAVKAAQVQ